MVVFKQGPPLANGLFWLFLKMCVSCCPSSGTGPIFQNYGLRLGTGPMIHLIVSPVQTSYLPRSLCCRVSKPPGALAGQTGKGHEDEEPPASQSTAISQPMLVAGRCSEV